MTATPTPCPLCDLGGGFHDEDAHAAIAIHPPEKSLPLLDVAPPCRACGRALDGPGEPGCRYPKHLAA